MRDSRDGAGDTAHVILTRLGVPKLWREDPDVMWAVMRYTVAPVMWALTRGAAYGVERVPGTGGAVIAANHLNAIDHPFLGLVCPRPVYFISKAELMEIPVLGELLEFSGAFPVNRGEPDRQALRTAREIVRDGHLLGIHVEGTRQRTGHPGAARRGAAMIAMQEGARILPLGLETYGWSLSRPRRCAAVWGEPISFDDLSRSRDGYTQATERIKAEIVRLWRLANEAVKTGFPEVLSDGTPRSRLPKPSADEVRAAWAAAGRREAA
jgi:1-acyl-sn-glycerol-3-phosphate acyltransferase